MQKRQKFTCEEDHPVVNLVLQAGYENPGGFFPRFSLRLPTSGLEQGAFKPSRFSPQLPGGAVPAAQWVHAISNLWATRRK